MFRYRFENSPPHPQISKRAPTSLDPQVLSQMGSQPPLRVGSGGQLAPVYVWKGRIQPCARSPPVRDRVAARRSRARHGASHREPADAWAQAAISRLTTRGGGANSYPTPPHTHMQGDTPHPCQAVSYHPEGPQRAAQLCRHLHAVSTVWGDHAAWRVPSPVMGTECVSWGLGGTRGGLCEMQSAGVGAFGGEGGAQDAGSAGAASILLCPVLCLPRLLSLSDRVWARG